MELISALSVLGLRPRLMPMRVDRLTARTAAALASLGAPFALLVVVPALARAQEPRRPVEILDPFAAPVAAASPEIIDPFPAQPAAGRARVVVRATSEILDPFVTGAVAMVSELLDPWAL
ncbi:MAG: hypothetical protein OHK0013_00880 [Sandaracinaceae bacterium]